MSTATTTAADDTARSSTEAAPEEVRDHAGHARLLVQPALVAAVVAGWVIWRFTADLDDIERRRLAWR